MSDEIDYEQCKCTMAQRMCGDGCSVCNPELAAELREETMKATGGLVSRRVKTGWMAFSQDEINGLDDDSWDHYKKGGCLCAAHSDSECICGSWNNEG